MRIYFQYEGVRNDSSFMKEMTRLQKVARSPARRARINGQRHREKYAHRSRCAAPAHGYGHDMSRPMCQPCPGFEAAAHGDAAATQGVAELQATRREALVATAARAARGCAQGCPRPCGSFAGAGFRENGNDVARARRLNAMKRQREKSALTCGLQRGAERHKPAARLPAVAEISRFSRRIRCE